MNEIFVYIESMTFESSVSFCSCIKSVFTVLKEDKKLIELAGLMKDWHNQVKVVDRINLLIARVISEDLAYLGLSAEEHPHDTAIAAYLFVLGECNPALVYTNFKRMFDHSTYWWARKVFERIRDEH